MAENTTDGVPAEFLVIFQFLVKALQPRHIAPDAAATYWAALRTVPLAAVRQAAEDLAQSSRYWPNTGDWYAAAHRLAVATASRPDTATRSIDDLDGLRPGDPERDDICKRLSVVDQQTLMAQYGYRWKED